MIVSIVIVTYNSADFIERCLEPLIAHIGDRIEVIIWDNASRDNTAEIVRGRYPAVRLLESRENLGFSKGNNEALAYCKGKFILLLNPDAFLRGIDQVWDLIESIQRDDNIGAVGPRLINSDKSHQVGDAGWAFNLANSVSHFLFLHKIFGSKGIFISNRRLISGPAVDVDWVCGACTLIRREVIKDIGGLDVGVFMYGEDVQWGMLIKSLDRRVVYVPYISVLHIQGASQKDSEDAPYFSVKWLDALFQSVAGSTSKLGVGAFKLAAAVGFFIRYMLLKLDHRLAASTRRARSTNMLKYALHVWRLRI
jgi:hypothetical protein